MKKVTRSALIVVFFALMAVVPFPAVAVRVGLGQTLAFSLTNILFGVVMGGFAMKAWRNGE